MNITQEKIDAVNAVVKIEVAADDYAPEVLKSINEFRRNYQMKGFRKGMVPKGLVIKMFGNQILAEKVNEILHEKVYNFIEEESISILGNPMPKEQQELNLDVKKMEDFTFEYELGVSPDFELNYLDTNPSFTVNKVVATDKEIDEQVERMTKQLGVHSEPDTISENDVLKVTFVELDADGNEKEGGINQETSISVDLISVAKTKKEILKAKKGDTVQVKPFKMFGKEKTKEEVLRLTLSVNLEDHPVETVGNDFNMTINNVTHLTPAEINEEFFTKAYPDGSVTDEAGMRAKIAEEFTAYFDQYEANKVGQEIVKELVENTEIELPDAFLKRWLRFANENPITPEQIEEEYPKFTEGLKWNLITNKLSKENEIVVSEDEILDGVVAMTRQQFIQYGMSHISDEQLKGFAMQQMQDQEYVSKTRQQLLEQKIIELIKDKCTIAEQEVTMEELQAQNAEA